MKATQTFYDCCQEMLRIAEVSIGYLVASKDVFVLFFLIEYGD